MGRSIVSKQEARVCDLENKLEFQRGQVKRFEVRTCDSLALSAHYRVRCLIAPRGSILLGPLLAPAGAGVTSARQRGAPRRGAGAERPGGSSGAGERPLLPAAPAGHEAGDGGADPERPGQRAPTHGAGKKKKTKKTKTTTQTAAVFICGDGE